MSRRRWLGCSALLLLLLVIGVPFLLRANRAYLKRANEARVRAHIAGEIAQVKSSGHTDVDILAAICVEDLVADPVCRPRVRSVFLWSDLRDQRWALLKELPNLEKIHVYDSRGADTFLKHLQGMKSLESLSFEATAVSDEGMRWIATLPNLKILEFARGDVTHKGIAHLQGHPSLAHLDFGGIRVTEAGMRCIATLPNLKHLRVEGDGVTNTEFRGHITNY